MLFLATITCAGIGLIEFIFGDEELLFIERHREKIETAQFGEDPYQAGNIDRHEQQDETRKQARAASSWGGFFLFRTVADN